MRNFLIIALVSMIWISCSEKEDLTLRGISLTNQSIDIDFDNTLELQVVTTPANAEFPLLTWETDNEKISTVDNNGKIKAVRVGKTIIRATTIDTGLSAECEVTVMPTFTFYKEPMTKWGATKSQLKEFETRNIEFENNDGISFFGESGNIRKVIYLYNNTGLSAAGVLLANLASSVENGDRHIKQRYEPIGFSGQSEVHYELNDTSVVLTFSMDLGIVAIYFKKGTTGIGGRNSEDQLIEQMKNVIKNSKY